MLKPASIRRLFALIFIGALAAVLFGTRSAFTDSVVQVNSLGALGENDSVSWSQLGPDATALTATINATSTGSVSVTGTLTAAGSLTSVVCPESPCSWGSPGSGGFNAGDTLVWTADTANGGNGPLKLTFGQSVKGVGAYIQADGPAQFTAQIQVFNGTTPLDSFTQSSDSNGDAVFLGALDSVPHITSAIYSITSCTGNCTDFAIDTIYINDTPIGPTPTPGPTPVATTSITTAPPSIAFGDENATGSTRAKRISAVNRGAVTADIGTVTVPSGFTIPAGTDLCSGRMIAARKPCTVEVEFTPASATTTYSGNLTIPYNGAAPATVSLSGTGTPVTLKAPNPEKFAPVAPGITGRQTNFFIDNESRTAGIVFGTASLSGPFSKPLDNCTSASVAAHGRCEVGLEFVPPQGTAPKTPLTGTLSYSFSYGSNSGMVMIQLTGTVK